ncbi:hypothetical protein F5887DRAFT_1083856 [Amanita rubescens]|nr:hypothetical protein F5887DRAFT_1083856 [Amanita rubescens]
MKKGSLSSKRFRNYGQGGVAMRQHGRAVSRSQVDREIAKNAARQMPHQEISSMESNSLNAIDTQSDGFEDVEMDESYMAEETLDGTHLIDLSHAGGEFFELVNDDMKRYWRRTRKDASTRKDRTENRISAFLAQMDAIVCSYKKWSYQMKDKDNPDAISKPSNEEVEGMGSIVLFDTYKTCKTQYSMIRSDEYVSAALVRQGMIPSAPFRPKYAFSTCLLALYRNLQCRCPHLARQSFVKGLTDMQGLPYKPYYTVVFSICVDLYLDILERVRIKVLEVLQRNRPLWRVKNTCPACSYKLHGEEDLRFKMLVAMDGNNSLKRLRRTGGVKNGMDVRRSRCALPDSRTAPGDYYLSREEVNKWVKDVHQKKRGAVRPQGNEEQTTCSSRWSNMDDKLTSRMWEIFDETGIFLALCRHSFVLLVTDMVRSGELAKYPLAITNILLQAFGRDLGISYDIGCKFGTTVENSPLGDLAAQLNFRALLSYLATYVEGLGLEDLEGCERFFSKSNAVAASVRYASMFHRQQSIVNYMRHIDNYETYANLSKFLVDNYKQALGILQSEPLLWKMMEQHGITDPTVFTTWLAEEKAYLTRLRSEPPKETLEMEYYEYLVEFYKCQEELDGVDVFYNTTPSNISQRDYMRSIETKRRHAIEKRDNSLKCVHELEVKLHVTQRWEPGSTEWKAAAAKVSLREYRRAVDKLESLVVSRLFELSKMNMSETCYKLRRHIAKALKARSKAIKAALEKYNTAAAARNPPAPQLTWSDIVDYAFLADFDLLRDTREDVHQKPWASQTIRVLRDQYFKLQRASEEIGRLNIEIRCVVTYMADETVFLRVKEDSLAETDPLLAHQIAVYRMERGRANATHAVRFAKLAKDPSFTGQITKGRSIHLPAESHKGTSGDINIDVDEDNAGEIDTHEDLEGNPDEIGTHSEDEEDDADEEDDEELEDEAYDMAYEVLKVTSDNVGDDDEDDEELEDEDYDMVYEVLKMTSDNPFLPQNEY